MDTFTFDPTNFLTVLLRLVASILLALPIAWNRERETRIMGLRSFPLIALASCAYILLADTALGESPDARARAIQGLMTGIGFVGGGAILKNGGGHVAGTATAVSIWTTGAIGATVALGAFDIAVLVSILNYAVLRILGGLKSEVRNQGE